MEKIYIGCGANVGDCVGAIERAIELLTGCGVRVWRVSSLYVTEPVGGPRQAPYLNCVVEGATMLSPKKVLVLLRRIERRLGRTRRVMWGPRTIDLDILAIGDKIIQTSALTVPHPRYHWRRFVLVPFCEIAPRFVHPIIRVENRSFLRRLTPMGQRVTMHAKWNKSRFYPFKKRNKTKSLSLR